MLLCKIILLFVVLVKSICRSNVIDCAESAVLLSGKPIRMQNEQPACDKRVTCKYYDVRTRQRQLTAPAVGKNVYHGLGWRDNLHEKVVNVAVGCAKRVYYSPLHCCKNL